MLRFIILLLWVSPLFAFDVVLEGLARVDKSQVQKLIADKDMSKLSVQNSVLKDLYRTGWFEKIDVSQSGEKLKMVFHEQPILTGFKVSSQIDVLTPVALKSNLESEGIKKGHVYNPIQLERWQLGVINYLDSVGYRSDIVTELKDSNDGKTAFLDIKVIKKEPIKLKVMKIIGSPVLSDGETMRVMEMYPTGWFSWFSKNDLYTDQKLELARAKLLHAYTKVGYLDAQVSTETVPIDKDNMSLEVKIVPNKPYKLRDVVFQDLPMVYHNEFLSQKGRVFDQNSIEKIKDRVEKTWQITADNPAIIFDVVELENNTAKLFVRGFIKGSPKIREVIYKDQYTDELALRRMSTIREGDKLTDEAIKKTKQNISANEFVKDVKIDVEAIPGSDDVNVVIQTSENNRHTQVSASVNWTSGGYGFSGVLGFDNKNWLNTGNQLAARLSIGQSERSASLSLSEPLSVYGPSSVLSMGVTQTNTSDLKMSRYKIDQGHVSYGYHWLVSGYNSLNASAKLNVMDLFYYQDSPQVIKDFGEKYGQSLQDFMISLGWRYNSLNRIVNPTSGLNVSVSGQISVPVIEQFLQSYKVDLSLAHYQELARAFDQPIVFKSRASLSFGRGYGYYSGDLPFFERYHAGGFGSVRGHRDNSLGPRSGSQRLGGNKRLLAGIELIVPSPKPDLFVPSLFVDMGNVFLDDIKLRDLVGSYGVATDFWLPVGTIMMSYSRSFNNEQGTAARNSFMMGIGQAI